MVSFERVSKVPKCVNTQLPFIQMNLELNETLHVDDYDGGAVLLKNDVHSVESVLCNIRTLTHMHDTMILDGIVVWICICHCCSPSGGSTWWPHMH